MARSGRAILVTAISSSREITLCKANYRWVTANGIFSGAMFSHYRQWILAWFESFQLLKIFIAIFFVTSVFYDKSALTVLVLVWDGTSDWKVSCSSRKFPCITRCIQSTILLDTSRVAAASWGQTCADCKSKGCISGDTTTVCWYSSSVQVARAS